MIILWILLWIFLIVIVFPITIMLILSVIPVCYRVSAHTGAGTSVYVTASYLLRLIYIKLTYSDNKTDVSVRIVGIKLRAKKKKETNKPKKTSTPGKPPKNPRGRKYPKRLSQSEPVKISLKDIKSVLTRKDLKIIIGLVLKAIKKTLVYLLPKRFKVTGSVGLNDPFQTGMFIGGLYGAAHAFNKNQIIEVNGDFSGKAISLDINAKGRVSAAGIAAPIIWLATRKPVFKIILEYIKSTRAKNKKENKIDEG